MNSFGIKLESFKNLKLFLSTKNPIITPKIQSQQKTSPNNNSNDATT